MTESERIELNRRLSSAQSIVFFGGAGVSTESGIPDFRSKDGLYNQHDIRFDAYTPEYLLSHDCLVLHPDVFFEFYRQKMNAAGILPNKAHLTLAKMEAEGRLSGVVTQNIDGLHQMAGSKVVYELHGTTHRNYCMSCFREVSPDFIFASSEPVPRCPSCGGMIRPDVTLYGEGLPEEAWKGAMKLISEADCLMIGGTSLSVYPAASLIDCFRGDSLIVINRDATPRDRSADLVLHETIGDVLSLAKYKS